MLSTEYSRPRPVRWSKVPDGWHFFPSEAFTIRGVEVYIVAPPVRKAEARVADGKEDDNSCKGGSKVKGGGEDVVVFGPPGEELSKSTVRKCRPGVG
jgi:hypothetical protein